MGPKIHATAVVHPEAQIDSSCEIGPFCVIGKGVSLGPRNHLISHVSIQNRIELGADNMVHPFAVLGGAPQDLKYEGEDTKLVIGDRNTIREAATLNIGTKGGGGVTRIGNDNLLMAYVHLGHDAAIGDHAVIGNSCQIAGHVQIGDYAILGGACAVSQFIRIGAHTYIGGMSGVDRDVLPFVLGRGIARDFEVLGLNLVGIKRRGFSQETVAALQEVSRLFFQDRSLEKEAALRAIEERMGGVPEVRYFVGFAREASKGVYR